MNEGKTSIEMVDKAKVIAELQDMVRKYNMGYQAIQTNVPPMPTRVSKLKKIEGNVNNTDVVIVYGDVKGNINNCDNVIIINGNVKGNLNNCRNVAGLLASEGIGEDALFEKSMGGTRVTETDMVGFKLHPPITLRE